MSQDHKARAQLRLETETVKEYLNAINSGATVVDGAAIAKRLKEIQDRIDHYTRNFNWVKVMEWMEKRNEAAELADFEELERNFIKVAAHFSERKGIRYNTWREVGVPAKVLKEAGISR